MSDVPKSPMEVLRELEAADPFDSRCNTQTGIEPARDTGWHLPISVRAFAEAMRIISVRHEDFVFVDIGSGKGRGVMLASEFPFKRCIAAHGGNMRAVNNLDAGASLVVTLPLHPEGQLQRQDEAPSGNVLGSA